MSKPDDCIELPIVLPIALPIALPIVLPIVLPIELHIEIGVMKKRWSGQVTSIMVGRGGVEGCGLGGGR